MEQWKSWSYYYYLIFFWSHEFSISPTVFLIRLLFSSEFPKSICLYIPVPSPRADLVVFWFVFLHSWFSFWGSVKKTVRTWRSHEWPSTSSCQRQSIPGSHLVKIEFSSIYGSLEQYTFLLIFTKRVWKSKTLV